MAREIERKWVVDRPFIPWKMIDEFEEDLEYQKQWYIDGVRYRHVETFHGWNSYIKTIKTGTGLDREEIEDEIDGDVFWGIINSKNSKPVRKTRYKIPYGDVTIELDLMEDFPFVYAEIEFQTVEQALAFDNVPYWFKEEVTNDQSHSMYNYFIRTNK
ncbi:CYTH-like phosphatase domain protein [Aeromonas phage ZPAH1]|nr:CYTH-like phosphatase domain protein [Aeromonas phage ZPAH1]